MRTTPFPHIIHDTPAPGVYPGLMLTPTEEESVSGHVVTLSLDMEETHVVRQPGFDLTDATVAPTGGSSTHR